MTADKYVEAGQDDALLIQAVQQGTASAFESLVDAHLEAIHAFVALKLPISQLIDEITHETFVFAFHHIHEFIPGTSFQAWLKTIAANKIRAEIERYCREQRNRLAYSEHRELQAALDSAMSEDPRRLEALHDCLSALPEDFRGLLNLKYHDESSSEEIARTMKRSIAWVRTTLFRVRQQLRDCVQNKLNASC